MNGDTENVGHMEDIDTAIQSLSVTQFLDIVEEVRLSAFTKSAWSDPIADIDFRTMARFLQEAELFFTIRQAVQRGDIGMLQRMVDPLIVVFFGPLNTTMAARCYTIDGICQQLTRLGCNGLFYYLV